MISVKQRRRLRGLLAVMMWGVLVFASALFAAPVGPITAAPSRPQSTVRHHELDWSVPYKIAGVELGMTEEQVLALAGRPSRISSRRGWRTWWYEGGLRGKAGRHGVLTQASFVRNEHVVTLLVGTSLWHGNQPVLSEGDSGTRMLSELGTMPIAGRSNGGAWCQYKETLLDGATRLVQVDLRLKSESPPSPWGPDLQRLGEGRVVRAALCWISPPGGKYPVKTP